MAVDSGYGAVVGYFLATNPTSFSPKYCQASISWRDEETRSTYDEIIRNNDYLYADQMGVLFEYHGTEVASMLFREYEKDYRGRLSITLVMKDPIDNVRSRGFVLKSGYDEICEILFAKYGSIDNFKGSLFVKQL